VRPREAARRIEAQGRAMEKAIALDEAACHSHRRRVSQASSGRKIGASLSIVEIGESLASPIELRKENRVRGRRVGFRPGER
jgi:hypothetical protein